MKLIDSEWHPQVNRLSIICNCGQRLKVRADRWRVVCFRCGRKEHLSEIRKTYKNPAYRLKIEPRNK